MKRRSRSKARKLTFMGLPFPPKRASLLLGEPYGPGPTQTLRSYNSHLTLLAGLGNKLA